MKDWKLLEYIGMWIGALVAAGLFYAIAFLVMSL